MEKGSPQVPFGLFQVPSRAPLLGREGIMLITVGDGELGEIRVRPD